MRSEQDDGPRPGARWTGSSQGPAPVLTWLVTQDDSWMSYSIQVDQLARNLMSAGSSAEAAAILARAAICQVASANS